MRIPAIALIAILLTACGPDGPNKADTGLIVGGVAGGIIGNQIGKGSGNVLATVAGAVIGGIVGSEIGRSMDEQDRRLAQEAEYAALEEGESDHPRHWRNPDNGRYGDVVPGRPYKRGHRIAATIPTPSISTGTPRPCVAPPAAIRMALGAMSPEAIGA